MTRNVGTSSEVVDAFVKGRAMRTPVASVPGGQRVSVDFEPDGTLSLYSYRTIVAIRRPDGSFAITPKKYGPSTGKLLGRIRGAIASLGARAAGPTVDVTVNVPGRWGGFGPAWHPTGRETLPFILYV